MKLTPDDPRLSAWLLGELPSGEAAAVERAVAADPALRLSVEELKRVARFLEGTLSTPPAGLRPAQREAVLKASRHADAAGTVVEFASAKRGLRPWLATLGAAAAVVLALTVASKVAAPRRTLAGKPGEASEISLLPLPGPRVAEGAQSSAAGGMSTAEVNRAKALRKAPSAFLETISRELANDPLPDPRRLPAVKPLPPLQSSGEISLPVLIGQSSPGWVRGWIRERAALPPKDAVRIEELVNAFPLPVENTGSPGVKILTSRCAWNDRSVLVAATLKGPSRGEVAVEWSFEPVAGARVRVLASPASAGSKLPDRLPAGRVTTILLEIEPAPDSDRLGVLKVDAAGEFTGHLVNRPQGEMDAAMRQLELAAAFGLWLRGEGIDRVLLESLLDDKAADDFRRLVRQALDIAAAGR